MSLIDEAMTGCVMLVRSSEPDGQGGEKTVWKDGEAFSAAIGADSPSVVISAERETLKRAVTVTTYLPKLLKFGEVFRREEDGAVFRVTSDSGDMKIPALASFQIAQCRAERWELT